MKKLTISRKAVLIGLVFVIFCSMVRTANGLNLLTSIGGSNANSSIAGWWKLDGSTADSSGHGLTLTANNVAATADHTGTPGKAYSFNGTSSYLSVPSSTYINSAGTYPAKSVTLWFKANDTNNTQYLWEEGDSNDGFSIYIMSGELYAESWGSSGGSWGSNSYSVPINVNQWSFAALSMQDGEAMQFYVNGVAASSTKTTTNGVFASHESAYIGKASGTTLNQGSSTNAGSGNYFFSGTMSDVRTFNRAISLSDIRSIGATSGTSSTLKLLSGQKGLVGHWKFDGNAKDDTPYSNNGTVNSATPTTDRMGASNKAYSFSGTNSYIGVPNASALQQTGDMTISFWANLTNDGNYQALVSKGLANEYEIAADFRSGATKLVWKSTNNDSTSVTNFDNFFSGYTGTPVFVSATISGSTLSVYRNGQLFNTWTIGSRSSSANDVFIGCRSTAHTFCAKGSMDDVRIYNRALAQTELSNLYRSYDSVVKVSTLQKGLVTRWKLDGNTKDATPFSNNGAIIGSGSDIEVGHRGQPGSAYSLVDSSACTDGYINKTLASPWTATNGFTVNLWVLPAFINGGSGYAFFNNNDGGTASSDSFQIDYLSSDYKYELVTTSGTVLKFGDIVLDWHMLTVTRSGNTWKAYLDGALTGSSTTLSATDTVFRSYTLGCDRTHSLYSTNENYFDDLRIWNRELTQAEVTALYKGE